MAAKLNLPDIDQGAAFKHSFFWFDLPDENNEDIRVPIDLTGFEAKIQGRKKIGDNAVLFEWSTANDCITIIGNEIRIFVKAPVTKDYNFDVAQYDLLVWPTADPDDKTRVVKGEVKLDKGITV